MTLPRGFSVIELLVGSAVTLAVTGALFAVIAPLQAAVERAHIRADLDASVRGSLQHLLADIREAGNGAAVEPLGAALASVLPSVVPLRSLTEPEPADEGSAVRLQYVPRLGAQGVLVTEAQAGETLLRLDTTSRCATGAPACGFAPGDAAVIYSPASSQVLVIDATGTGVLTTRTPLQRTYAAGSVVSALVHVTYGVRSSPDADRLVRMTTGGAEQPITDHVVRFAARTDTVDPAAARAVFLTLRLQAPAPEFRGPAGHLFVRAGTATDARRWVPDVEWQTVVALRRRTGAP